MKREIKFRGISSIEGHWIYGSLVCYGDVLNIIDEAGDEWGIEPNSQGQFISLLDKNGKEIYEEDILAPMDNDFRPEYTGNWVVVYEGGTFAAEGNSERISTWIPYWVPDKQIEVIGNKFENPDLK